MLRENNRGANGYLYLARNKISEKEVAIKFYSGEPGDHRHDEPKQLAQIASPHVLPILEARKISDDWAYFVTPWCTGGDLDDYFETSPSAHTAIDVAIAICKGASAIHAAGMLHRDLKPGNIVMENGRPLIADFGSVRILPKGHASVVASRHTALYRPPESFSTSTYTVQGDVYQIGVITYQLLGGRLSYEAQDHLRPTELAQFKKISDAVEQSRFVDEAIRRRAAANELLQTETLPPWITPAGKKVIRNMTDGNPKKRLANVAEAVAALNRLRGNASDWKSTPTGALLETPKRVVEIRRQKAGPLYDAFYLHGNDPRRAPKGKNGTLAELVRRFSED